MKWGFEVVPSSPEYPRGHGLIERHVQTVKKCMHKCDHSGHDIDLALLSLRSTPLDSHMPSPAELLNNRKYRTTMPSINNNQTPINNEDIREQLEHRQLKSKQKYDQHTTDKRELADNEQVRVRNQKTRLWEPAHVIQKAKTPRSYIVQRCAGGIPLRRNRQHIRPTHEQWRTGDFVANEDFENGNENSEEYLLHPQEMVVSEPSLRHDPSTTTQEMVDSEPSLRTSDGDQHQPKDVQRRYPVRVRERPDFYQAGC